MTRAEAIADIQLGLGFRTDQDANIVIKLRQAQREYELGRTLPYFLKIEDATLTIPLGSAEVALPTGFIREVDDDTIHYTNPSTLEVAYLEKFTDINRIRQTLTGPDVDDGYPLAYLIRATSILILPARVAAVSATWSYYKNDADIEASTTNLWLTKAPDALVGKAGALMCEAIGLSDAAMQARWKAFADRANRGWEGIRNEAIERDLTNYPLNMGSRL